MIAVTLSAPFAFSFASTCVMRKPPKKGQSTNNGDAVSHYYYEQNCLSMGFDGE
jgi:hypothetical protein